MITIADGDDGRLSDNTPAPSLPRLADQELVLRELRRLTSQTGTRRLLIVDDNEVSRYIMRELLDRPWLDVTEAKSGSEALDLIEEAVPDAVILDLLMPDMSGMEVLRRVRGRPPPPRSCRC